MNHPIPNEHHDNTRLPPSTSSNFAMQQQHMTRTAKLKLMKDKAKELDELRRIKDLSAQLDQHFIRVANDTHELAEGNLGIAGVMSNWDCVFETMGLMNTKTEPDANNTTMIRLPIVARSRTPGQ